MAKDSDGWTIRKKDGDPRPNGGRARAAVAGAMDASSGATGMVIRPLMEKIAKRGNSVGGGPGDSPMTSEQKKDMYSPWRTDTRNESPTDATLNRTPQGQLVKWAVGKVVGGLPQEPNRFGKKDRENVKGDPMDNMIKTYKKSKNPFPK